MSGARRATSHRIGQREAEGHGRPLAVPAPAKQYRDRQCRWRGVRERESERARERGTQRQQRGREAERQTDREAHRGSRCSIKAERRTATAEADRQSDYWVESVLQRGERGEQAEQPRGVDLTGGPQRRGGGDGHRRGVGHVTHRLARCLCRCLALCLLARHRHRLHQLLVLCARRGSKEVLYSRLWRVMIMNEYSVLFGGATGATGAATAGFEVPSANEAQLSLVSRGARARRGSSRARAARRGPGQRCHAVGRWRAAAAAARAQRAATDAARPAAVVARRRRGAVRTPTEAVRAARNAHGARGGGYHRPAQLVISGRRGESPQAARRVQARDQRRADCGGAWPLARRGARGGPHR